MIFNSVDFILFFPVVYLLYLRIDHKKQNILLLIASYFFYGYWDYRFLSLLVLSTIIDYYASLGIEANRDNPSKKKYFLYLSIFSNLGILGFFKYFNFFIKSAVSAFGAFGIQMHEPTLNIILPLGISFYTFQTMSYTIDVYRGDLKPTRNFLDFALFVTFFPQLVAGPIERATNLLPQITNERKVTFDNIKQGAFLILFGFYKKIYIADNMATIVDPFFAQDATLIGRTGAEAFLGSAAFVFQIYGDFSGYSDIARGISKFMGVELIRNFNHPLFSQNINDFWRRWHISFMNWLRDYVYVPLGGKNDSEFKQHLNSMIVFPPTNKYLVPINVIFTFVLVVFSCFFFRAQDISTALTLIKKVFLEFGTVDPKLVMKFFRLAIPFLLIEFYQYIKNNEYSIFELKTFYRVCFYLFYHHHGEL